MTAPDPRPYLLPTDLRTAEDVARWLRARDEAHDGAETLADAVAALRARLDRERRQACRRAVRAWAYLARMHRRHAAMYRRNDDHGEAASRLAARVNALTLALAFRAAARARD